MGTTVNANCFCLLLLLGWQPEVQALGLPAGEVSSAHPAVVDETAISLDGKWRFRPFEAAEQDLVVPSFWDREPGLRDVHQGVFQRVSMCRRAFAAGGLSYASTPWVMRQTSR